MNTRTKQAFDLLTVDADYQIDYDSDSGDFYVYELGTWVESSELVELAISEGLF